MSNQKDKPLFFSVHHIIKAQNVKLIYGVQYNGLRYFLFKTQGVNDCEQLDYHPKLAPDVFNMMCEVITEIEREYKKTPPVEFINFDIFNFMVRTKNPMYDLYKNDHPGN
ncbi:MAG: hypothetical protein M3N14_11135 [Bacteroidota bacterium]|nr:hypothetical protein [Bacteroidota bacterium]